MDRGRHSSTLIRPFRECLGELGVQLRPIRWSIVLRVLLGVVEVGASLCVVWLSKQLGCAPTTVSKWCTNSSQPPLESLMKITRLLDVELKDLVRFEELDKDEE